MSTKIIILGASGFVGSYIYERLSENSEYDVKGYSSKDCNLLSLDSINSALSDVTPNDIIVMTSSITRTTEDSFDSMIKNISMVNNLSKFLENHPVKQIVFLSSVDVYGVKPQIPLSEKLLPMPDNYYGISKICGEFILRKICSRNKTSLLVLRLPGMYNIGENRTGTINKLIESAKKGKIIIYGDGEDKRDFIYIDDVYKIIELTTTKNVDLTLNISSGKSHSINKIVEMIRLNFPKSFDIEYQEKNEGDERIKEIIFDSSLLKDTFPDLQPTNLENGIIQCIKNG